jgi:flagellar M-ring protein FliF
MSAEAATLPMAYRVGTGMKPIMLLIGVAAAIAAGVGVAIWTKGPTYGLLFAGLTNQDSSQVVQALDAAKVPYKLDPGSGAISVPADQVQSARLQLAGQGLPEGDNAGFAVMSKDPGFGVSQFMENARYQHALETELAKTITSLQAVGGARVHLAIPRQSAFVRDRQSSSASVFLQMKPGRRLESEQVTAIINLVASSVPELEAGQVTVVDQQGRLLSSPNSDDALGALPTKQFEFARRLEEDYVQRIEQLLTPLVGAGRVRAQVAVDVEMGVTEEAREKYTPESAVVRSENLAEQSSTNGSGPQGVPGALSNQPPAPGVVLPPGQAAGAQAAANAASTDPQSLSKQTTRNYEIDRTVSHTRLPAGRLKRLSVAVIVDNPPAAAVPAPPADARADPAAPPAAAPTATPLSAEEVENLTRLVKDAVGFDQARGDSVNVMNAPFHAELIEPVEPLEAAPIWEKPWVQDLIKLTVGLIVLLILVFVVLKPLTRGLLASAKAAALPVRTLLQAQGGAAAAGAGQGATQPGTANGAPLAYEQQVAQARTLVQQDPRRVAQVVKTWVAEDE